MKYFTEEQIKELSTIFGITPKETNKDVFNVRGGVVSITDRVWWHSENGPQLVSVEEHSYNIKNYPNLYSIIKPLVKVEYIYE